MTRILFRGGPARGLERWYDKPPPGVIVERGTAYIRTEQTSKGRIVYEWISGRSDAINDWLKQVKRNKYARLAIAALNS